MKYFGSDLESYLSFSNLYGDEYHKTRPCTANDFAGIEHVYEMKTRKFGQDSMICPDNLENLKIQGNAANRNSQKTFSLIIGQCIHGYCETDEEIIQRKYEKMHI